MKFIATELPGVTVIEPDVFRDDRGFFLESWRADKYAAGGIEATFVQHNHSRSARGTVRGLHAQRRHPQGKLVRVLAGAVLDVVVDIRRGSPTWLNWISLELSAENFRQLYVPPGYAHGICVISQFADLEYQCTDFYDPQRRAPNHLERSVDRRQMAGQRTDLVGQGSRGRDAHGAAG